MKVDGIEIVIESNATKACAELDRMIAKLNKVNASILLTGKAGKGGSVSGMTSGLKSYTTSASKATKSTASLAAMFGKFYASCFLAIRGVKALGRAIESSMDYIETYNYYNVIMDKIGAEFGGAWKENGYNSAEEYAKSFKQRLNALTGEMTGFKIGEEGGLYASDSIGLGLDPDKIMGFQAEVSSITNAVGLMGEAGLNTSKALTMLSADLSSLKNQDLETVMTNLRSGLIGQSRALYKYGIDITNNTLQTYALANGIEKAVSEMTQAEKMQLRLLAILDQSKVAYGDMANTISGVANQYRVFKQQVSNLARIIGNLFIPVLQKVLPYVNGFIIALQRLFTWIGNLLGVDWSKMMDGISSGYNDTGLDALGEDAEDLTGGLDDASKAAKKLKSNLQGFDQLNVIATQQDSSSGDASGSSGGIDLSGAIADALGDYESIWDKAMADMENKAQAIADRLIAAFKKGDYEEIGAFIGDKLRIILENIDWQKIYNVAYKFGYNFADFLNGLITPELFGTLGKTIASSLNTAMKAALGFGETLDWEQMGESIASGINSFFDTFDFATFGETLNTFAEGFAEFINGVFKDLDFEKIATSLNTFVDKLEEAVRIALTEIDWEYVFSAVKSLMTNLEFDTVAVIVSAITIKKIGTVAIGAAIKEAFGAKIAGLIGTITLPKLIIAFASLAVGGNGMGTAGFDGIAMWVWNGIEDALYNLLPAEVNKFLGEFVAGFSIAGVASGGNPFIALIGALLYPAKDVLFDASWAKEWWGAAVESFKTAFDGDRQDFLDMGGYIIDGIGEGLIAALAFIVQPIDNVFQYIYEAFCNAFKSHSPAETMTPIGENIILGIIKGFTDSSGEFLSTISGFVNTVVSAFATLPGKIWLELNTLKNRMIIAFTNIKTEVLSIWNNIVNTLKNIHIPTPHFNFNGETKFTFGSFKTSIPKFKVDWYANGGFPSSGEIWGMNEAGNPEMVGSVGGKTAVVNNGQIIDGIASGVSSANRETNQLLRQLISAVRETGSTIEINGREVFTAVKEENAKYKTSTGKSAFA